MVVTGGNPLSAVAIAKSAANAVKLS